MSEDIKTSQEPKIEDSKIEAPAKVNDGNQSNDRKESEKESLPKSDNSKADYVTREQFDAVRGDASAKAKQLSALQSDLQKLRDREAVKDIILDADYPDAIKSKLKGEIDILTPENIKERAEGYLDIYQKGVESYKSQQANAINSKPEREAPKDFSDKLNSTKSLKDLENLLKEAR